MKKLFFNFFLFCLFWSFLAFAQEDEFLGEIWNLISTNDILDFSFMSSSFDKYDASYSYISFQVKVEWVDYSEVDMSISGIWTKKLSDRWSSNLQVSDNYEIVSFQNIQIPRSDSKMVLISLDTNNVQAESDETNNTKYIAVQPKENKPDLYISSFSYYSAKHSINVNACLKGASKINTSIYLSVLDRKKILSFNLNPWCQSVYFDVKDQSLDVTKKWNYTVSAVIDEDWSIDESDENNNTYQSLVYIDLPDPILPDLYIQNTKYDNTKKQLSAYICRDAGDGLWYENIGLEITMANKKYNISNNLNLWIKSCKTYAFDIPQNIQDWYYTSSFKIVTSLSEKNLKNNISSLGFNVKSDWEIKSEKPVDIVNSVTNSGSILSNYDILTTYCEYNGDYITKCTKLYDLESLKQASHLILGNVIVFLDNRLWDYKKISDQIDIYRSEIQELQPLFVDSDPKVQVRLSLIFAYIGYGLDLYSRSLNDYVYQNNKQNMQAVRKFFFMQY